MLTFSKQRCQTSYVSCKISLSKSEKEVLTKIHKLGIQLQKGSELSWKKKEFTYLTSTMTRNEK